MHRFRDLKIWQQSRVIVKEIYILTESFPSTEIYGLTSQVRRAIVSASSNIAEGAGRETPKEFCRFLDIAMGSAFEVETQILLSMDLGYLSDNSIIENIHELQNMIFGFKKYLEKNEKQS